MDAATSATTFDAHRAIGERLLKLGRSEEALSELVIAREIARKDGAIADPLRRGALADLNLRITNTKHLLARKSRRDSLLWLSFCGLLSLALTVTFAFWMFERNSMFESELVLLTEIEQLVLDFETLEKDTLAIGAFSEQQKGIIATRDARIWELETDVATLQQALATLEPIADESDNVARMAQTIADLQAALNAMEVAPSEAIVAAPVGEPIVDAPDSAAAEPLIMFVSEEAVSDVQRDQLRITEFSSSVRSGPGFGYPILEALAKESLVTVDGRSSDYYWYHVVLDGGRGGWVHTSLAKPIVMDWLPEIGVSE